MAGNYLIDSNSFTGMIYVSSLPREKFGSSSGEQERTDDGIPKWSLEVAVSFPPAHGRKVPSEVISVTVASHSDPAEGLTPGLPVTLDNLRLGVSAAQLRGDRVSGGKPWFIADAVRSTVTPYRAKSEAAAS